MSLFWKLSLNLLVSVFHWTALVGFKTEELFARDIRNIIAHEGRDMTERHECFGKWRKLMEQGGFQMHRDYRKGTASESNSVEDVLI